ncbi:MAG: hypothetical protein ACE5E8_11710 [Acidimicrobiia bacterium]
MTDFNFSDMDSFTLGELKELEALTGKAIGTILEALDDRRGMSLDMLTAILTVVGRRTNPEFTMADADNVRITDLTDQGMLETVD